MSSRPPHHIRANLSAWCRTHAQKMQEEGFYVTANVLSDAADALEERWQPIETAPRDGTLILVGNAAPGFPMPARWKEEYGVWVFPNNQCIKKTDRQPELWRPLPDLPPRKAQWSE